MIPKTFILKAPNIMARLLRDIPGLGVTNAAAILGNLGHECAGFTSLQERNPTVSGSRGGYGWAQWTGPRRLAFEKFCAVTKLDPASDTANYSFLLNELTGTEKGAIPKLKAAHTLNEKVVAFERGFLRAGTPHYASRQAYAVAAFAAFNGRD